VPNTAKHVNSNREKMTSIDERSFVQLQWKTNRNLHVICLKATLLMTLNSLEGYFSWSD